MHAFAGRTNDFEALHVAEEIQASSLRTPPTPLLFCYLPASADGTRARSKPWLLLRCLGEIAKRCAARYSPDRFIHPPPRRRRFVGSTTSSHHSHTLPCMPSKPS